MYIVISYRGGRLFRGVGGVRTPRDGRLCRSSSTPARYQAALSVQGSRQLEVARRYDRLDDVYYG